jgi:hypothetical protein
VKVFLWRACHNLLPTKVNLFTMGVVDKKLCPICIIEEETIFDAHDVWGCGPICLQKCSTVGDRFASLFVYLTHRLSSNQLALMAMVARRIWFRRNALVFEDKFVHPNTIFVETATACEDFQKCNSLNGLQASSTGGEHVQIRPWQHPSPGVININWDASLNKGTGCIGFGYVARDHLGNFLGAKCSFKRAMVEPKVVEVMSAHHAITFDKEVGFSNVIFEGMLFKLSPPPQQHLNSIGYFIESIHQVHNFFESSSFVYCHREANGMGHSLC